MNQFLTLFLALFLPFSAVNAQDKKFVAPYKYWILKPQNSQNKYNKIAESSITNSLTRNGYPAPSTSKIFTDETVNQCQIITVVYDVENISETGANLKTEIKFVDCNYNTLLTKKDLRSFTFLTEKNVILTVESVCNNFPSFENIPIADNPSPTITPAQVQTQNTAEVVKPKPAEAPKPKAIDPVDTDIPLSNVTNNKSFALIVGNENYLNEIVVPFAKNDASVFADYCKKTLGMPGSNIHLLTNATYGQMLGEIKWLTDITKVFNGEARIIFYYAGHGMPDEKTKSAYLLPVDGNSTIPATALKVDDLYARLIENPSKMVTVYLDACFSGGSREGSLIDGRGVKIRTQEEMLHGNLLVFSATSGDETAFPLKDKNHGLFTYYLLKQLQTTKGNATFEELTNGVAENVRQQSVLMNNKIQNPKVRVSNSLNGNWGKITVK